MDRRGPINDDGRATVTARCSKEGWHASHARNGRIVPLSVADGFLLYRKRGDKREPCSFIAIIVIRVTTVQQVWIDGEGESDIGNDRRGGGEGWGAVSLLRCSEKRSVVQIKRQRRPIV